MFNNIQKYLDFFKDAKNNNFPLIKGKLPKVTFLKYKFTILFATLFILYTFFGFGLIPNIFYYYFKLNISSYPFFIYFGIQTMNADYDLINFILN